MQVLLCRTYTLSAIARTFCRGVEEQKKEEKNTAAESREQFQLLNVTCLLLHNSLNFPLPQCPSLN